MKTPKKRLRDTLADGPLDVFTRERGEKSEDIQTFPEEFKGLSKI